MSTLAIIDLPVTGHWPCHSYTHYPIRSVHNPRCKVLLPSFPAKKRHGEAWRVQVTCPHPCRERVPTQDLNRHLFHSSPLHHAPGGLGEIRPPLLRDLTSLLRRATFPGHRGTLPPSIPEKQETLQQLLILAPEKLSSNQEPWPSASFMGLCALMFSLEVLHGKY